MNDGDIQLCEVLGTALATDESLFYFFLFGLARIASSFMKGADIYENGICHPRAFDRM